MRFWTYNFTLLEWTLWKCMEVVSQADFFSFIFLVRINDKKQEIASVKT